MPHLRDAGASTPQRSSRADTALRWFQLEPRAVPGTADRQASTAAVELPILKGERPIDRFEAERPAA